MNEPSVQPSNVGQKISEDDTRIHAHVFSFQHKPSLQPDFKKQLLRRVKSEGDSKRAKGLVEEYATLLSSKRAELMQVLDRRGSELNIPDGTLPEFEAYVGLLVGLAFDGSGSAAEPSTEASSSAQQLGVSLMRDAVEFSWHDVLFNRQSVASADAVYELVSVILAMAGARSRYVAYLCRDARAGTATPQASQAYRLLAQSARELRFVSEQLCPILQQKSGSADCTPEAVKALLDVTCGDVQSISVLRSMAKNSTPGLVSSLSLWAADSYRSAAFSARNAPFSVSAPKIQLYAEFKATFFRAYALVFQGLARLKEDQAGQALKLIAEAQKEAKASLPLSAAFNKGDPATPAAEHSEFDQDLKICVESAQKRAAKENDNVYFQRIPAELPDLPAPRAVIPDISTYQLPGSAPIVLELQSLAAFSAAPVPDPPAAPAGDTGGPAAGVNAPSPAPQPQKAPADTQTPAGKPEEEGGASCFRWLLVIIAMPLIVMISVVGLLIWIILLPIKIICCPIGCLVQIIADVVQYLLKAPLNALLWASGKPYKKRKTQDEEAQRH